MESEAPARVAIGPAPVAYIRGRSAARARKLAQPEVLAWELAWQSTLHDPQPLGAAAAKQGA
jgi:hypothetical protein